MAETVGQGVIELVGDARKLKASIEDAKKSIRTLGEGQKDISAGASQSIDRFIGKLQQQNATFGKSTRETELFKLSLRGASNEQLKVADAALRIAENNQRNAASMEALRISAVRVGAVIGTALVTGTIAAAVAFDQLVKKAGNFQDIAEKVGDTAESFASLAVAAAVGGTSMEELTAASVRLTKGLTGVDDESKAAGAAVEALGLNLAAFKNLAPSDQIEAVAKALSGFKDGAEKTAVAVALFGKSGAQMLPFLRELGEGIGRQNILTGEQIRLADDYADKQKRLTTEIGLYASAIASQMLPAVNDLTGAFLDIIKGIAGVEVGVKGLRNSTAIQEFAEGGARALAILADNFIVVGRTAEIVMTAIGTVSATVFSAMSGRTIQAIEVAKEGLKQIQEIAKRPFTEDLLNQRTGFRKAEGQFRDNFDKELMAGARPKLPFTGAAKKDSGADPAAARARAEAAAQLQFDLDQIKKAGDVQRNTFSNSEKIMQALRNAALVSDQDYFASKLAFIQLHAQSEERELVKQIERLKQEQFTGETAAKDRINNLRKIADVEAQLAKVQENAAVDTKLNSIEQEAANRRIAQSLREATIAADAYIETIAKRNERELEGIGRGAKFRDELAGRGDIDDRMAETVRRLKSSLDRDEITKKVFDEYLEIANRAYTKEVDLYVKRTDAINAAQKDWTNGARRALENYYEDSMNIAQQTEDAFVNAFQGLEDALLEFTKTGKLNFKSFADSVVTDINRMLIKQNVTGPFAEWLKGASSGNTGGGGGAFDFIANLFKKGGTGSAVPIEWSGSGFETGTPFVPETGIYQLHKGERVITAAENAAGGGRNVNIYFNNVFPGQQNTTSVAQGLVKGGRQVQRELARGTA